MKDRYDPLERANFKVDRKPDLMRFLNERRGGHYVDIGATDKIICGQIQVKSDSKISGFTSTGLIFENDSTVDADVIVFATGYEKNMRLYAERFLGKKISDQIDDFAGIDPEGEVRGCCKALGRKCRKLTIRIDLILSRSSSMVSWRRLCGQSFLFPILGFTDQGRCCRETIPSI
jgi:hypothetical protein